MAFCFLARFSREFSFLLLFEPPIRVPDTMPLFGCNVLVGLTSPILFFGYCDCMKVEVNVEVEY